jgi:hypothetical protein
MQVFFFGGYQADSGDVMGWARSVEKKVPGARAFGFPYPIGASSGTRAMESWNLTPTIVAMLNDGDIVVGHSSGCMYANDVAGAALRANKIFKLVALDGFVPNESLLALDDTRVWSAKCGAARSLNYDGCRRAAGDKFEVYNADVSNKWPLHFSLVNLNASDNFSRINDGYYHIDANIDVLSI